MQSMGNIFDNNLNQINRASSALSKKLSIRRPTKKIEGTILNRNKNIVTLV